MSGLLAATMTAMPGSAAAVRLDAGPAAARTPLQRALNKLVAMPSGPPGVIVIVQHGGWRAVYQAGTASLAQPRPLATTDHERLASVSKAFNGAVALSLVSRGKLRLSDTIGRWLPGSPGPGTGSRSARCCSTAAACPTTPAARRWPASCSGPRTRSSRRAG